MAKIIPERTDSFSETPWYNGGWQKTFLNEIPIESTQSTHSRYDYAIFIWNMEGALNILPTVNDVQKSYDAEMDYTASQLNWKG